LGNISTDKSFLAESTLTGKRLSGFARLLLVVIH
jgi:hypothetical protein